MYAEQRGDELRYYYLETTVVPKHTTSVDTDTDASEFSLAELDDLVREINKNPKPDSLRSYVDPLTMDLPLPHTICRLLVDDKQVEDNEEVVYHMLEPYIFDFTANHGIQHKDFRLKKKAPVTKKNIVAAVPDPIMKQAYIDALRLHAKQHYAKRTVKRTVTKSALETMGQVSEQVAEQPEYKFELLGKGVKAFGQSIEARLFGLERLKNAYRIFRKNQSERVGEDFLEQSRGWSERPPPSLNTAQIDDYSNQNEFVDNLIDTTVALTKPKWIEIKPTVYMAEIWLLNTSPKDDRQDIGKFVRVIPDLPANRAWKWTKGESPSTHFYGRKLRLAEKPWQRVASNLLTICFTGDVTGSGSGSNPSDRMTCIDKHLKSKSTTCKVVEATDEEKMKEMHEAMRNYMIIPPPLHSHKFEIIVVHVYAVVNNEEKDHPSHQSRRRLPSEASTPWEVTGIYLRSHGVFTINS